MEATVTVTLKLTPREFDLVRMSIEIRQKQQHDRGQRRPTLTGPDSINAATIQASRQESVELTALLKKLR